MHQGHYAGEINHPFERTKRTGKPDKTAESETPPATPKKNIYLLTLCLLAET